MVVDTRGPAYDEAVDEPRLGRQLEVIRDLMLKKSPLTLREIRTLTGYPEASISAQLRHLRKVEYGSYRATKARRAGTETDLPASYAGTWEYTVKPPAGQASLFPEATT